MRTKNITGLSKNRAVRPARKTMENRAVPVPGSRSTETQGLESKSDVQADALQKVSRTSSQQDDRPLGQHPSRGQPKMILA
jgi:hypothetical protein